METSRAVAKFAALSQETRLSVVRLLVTLGHQGISAGELATAAGVPASTLSFHLKELAAAELVTSEREGRQIRYRANLDGLSELIMFLTEDCCANDPQVRDPLFKALSCAC